MDRGPSQLEIRALGEAIVQTCAPRPRQRTTVPPTARPRELWHRTRRWVDRALLLAAVMVSLAAASLVIAGPDARVGRLLFNASTTQAVIEAADPFPLPQGAVARLGTLALREIEPIGSLAISPDGRLAASCANLPVVHVWDVLSGRLVVALESNADPLSSVAFSPDGRWFAIGGWDGRIRLWQIDGWRSRGTIHAHEESMLTMVRRELSERLKLADCPYTGYVASIAFLGGDRLVSCGGDGMTKIWDVATRRLLADDRTNAVPCTALAVAGDQSTFAVASGDHLRLYDASDGQRLARITLPRPAVYLALSPDGSRIAVCSYDPQVHIWDVSSQQQVQVLRGSAHGPLSLAYLPAGELVTCSLAGEIQQWDPASGTSRLLDAVEPAWVSAVHTRLAISHDGRALAATTAHKICNWDLATLQRRGPVIGHANDVTAVAFADRQEGLLSAGLDGSLRRWELHEGRQLDCRMAGGPITAAAWHPAAARSITAGGFCNYGSWTYSGLVESWDGQSLVPKRLLSGMSQWVFGADIAPDGRTVALAGYPLDRATQSDAFDRRGLLLVPAGDDSPDVVRLGVFDFASPPRFSPDGLRLAAAVTEHEQNGIRLWDPASGEVVETIATGPLQAAWIAFSGQGEHLVGCSAHGEIGCWEVATGQRVWLTALDSGAASALASSRERGLLAVCTGKQVHLLEALSGSVRACFDSTQHHVSSAAFSPDGGLLATGGVDTTVLVWGVDERLAGGAPHAFQPRPIGN